jgi:capsular exopolysaccharide synthesis family protein
MEEKDLKQNIEEIKNNIMEEEEQSSLNFRTIFSMVILNWQWFALSIIICVCCAALYLRYTDPVYEVQTKLLVKDDQSNKRGYGNQMLSNMQDLGFMSNSAGIDNEVEILQSHVLAEQAVRDLKLYIEYKLEGRVKDQDVYKTQPVNVDIDQQHLNTLPDMYSPISMEISKEGTNYVVNGSYYTQNRFKQISQGTYSFEKKFNSLPASIYTRVGLITISENPGFYMTAGRKLFVTIHSPRMEAMKYVGGLTVEPSSKTTSIALITLHNNDADRAIDYLKQLAICYNRQANEDKNEIAVKTEEFINNRLSKINTELGSTEGQLESYKKSNKVTELKLDASSSLAASQEYGNKLTDANTQLQLINYLSEYVNTPENKYQIIPSNVGLTDQSSTSLINSYNETALKRNRLLATYAENSPNVIPLTEQMDRLLHGIKTALNQANRSAQIMRNSIQKQYNMYEGRIGNTPEQERMLTQIGRQQEVKSGLYLMLLQKREENSISLAATADKGKLIDEPQFMGKVSPKSSIILLISLVIGIGLPFFILYVLQLLKYKIEGHEDVVRLTRLPVIADVAVANPDALNNAGIVVHENQNNQMEEIFRSMRTNLQFMMKKEQKVIMFTSSTSGEGKTFNAANLAMSFALLGKKVLLVGLDIRKPRLGELFGLHNHSKVGITNFLSNDGKTKEEIIHEILPSGVNANLDLLMAGPVPPNPAELLARESLDTAINFLKEVYDFVILDTAPVGLVTDTLQIGRCADATIYICRADYTPKESFGMINSLASQNKIPNPCIVLNGVDMSKKKYGYYYGYGKYGKYGRYGRYTHNSSYGYGGYGYGNYGNYGNYSNSHYSNENDNSVKH